MNPFFFGSGERRLFGLYAPGRTGAGARALVLCHAWGQEYLRAHRAMQKLAGLLQRAGHHVLRFDYFGTGDSAGSMADGDLRGWEGDIEAAIEELRDTTGIARVGLVGLRLGATLAARVAARRRKDVDALVLWDPVVAGAEYLGELRRAATPGPAPSPTAAGESLEVLGFPLTSRVAKELAALDLVGQVAALPARTLVIATEPLATHAPLRQALAARPGAPAPVEDLPDPPAWIEDQSSGIGALPVKVLQRIAQWIG
jgi:pimeloyl-ACP methyl ester carboxylesterase